MAMIWNSFRLQWILGLRICHSSRRLKRSQKRPKTRNPETIAFEFEIRSKHRYIVLLSDFIGCKAWHHLQLGEPVHLPYTYRKMQAAMLLHQYLLACRTSTLLAREDAQPGQNYKLCVPLYNSSPFIQTAKPQFLRYGFCLYLSVLSMEGQARGCLVATTADADMGGYSSSETNC